jgi:hypothetical protein
LLLCAKTFYVIHGGMASESKDPSIGLRVTPEMLTSIDEYVASRALAEPHRRISRSDAMRELLARGLAEVTRPRKRSA